MAPARAAATSADPMTLARKTPAGALCWPLLARAPRSARSGARSRPRGGESGATRARSALWRPGGAARSPGPRAAKQRCAKNSLPQKGRNAWARVFSARTCRGIYTCRRARIEFFSARPSGPEMARKMDAKKNTLTQSQIRPLEELGAVREAVPGEGAVFNDRAGNDTCKLMGIRRKARSKCGETPARGWRGEAVRRCARGAPRGCATRRRARVLCAPRLLARLARPPASAACHGGAGVTARDGGGGDEARRGGAQPAGGDEPKRRLRVVRRVQTSA